MKEAILGTWVGIAFAVWVYVQVSGLVRRICKALSGALTPRTHIDATINQMYGDVRLGEREYAGTRNARQALTRQSQSRKVGS